MFGGLQPTALRGRFQDFLASLDEERACLQPPFRGTISRLRGGDVLADAVLGKFRGYSLGNPIDSEDPLRGPGVVGSILFPKDPPEDPLAREPLGRRAKGPMASAHGIPEGNGQG